ncbi:acyltransferase family protein [Paraburkholderia tagetis]|uniref:Acyltransferase n=1 Tax=Paraburkholderia tagetis TaxID=2913261 RepID=A0A9X2A1C0_9BURK|nr:acyltransferase [Paraburkholderia tagetis]MCG5077826.1 acyltransferase [Paraburkholderia tagetis]
MNSVLPRGFTRQAPRKIERPDHIDSLDCLRGLSALLVMCYHYREFLNYVIPHIGNTLFENGRIGVDIFFILSGFVMYTTTQSVKNQLVLPFLIKRAFRVVPLAWLLITIIFISEGSANWQAYVLSLMFVPLSNTDAPFFGYNILSPGWTLSYELWFYVMFGTGMLVSKAHRGLAAGAVLLGCVFGLQALSHTPLYLDAYPATTFTGHLLVPAQIVSQLSSPLFLEFLLGIGVAYLYANCRARWLAVNEKIRSGVYLFFAAYTLSHFFSGYAMGHGLTRKGLPALALFSVYLCADFDGLLNKVKGFIRGPGGAFVFLGRISFSLYIVHEPLHQFIGCVPVMAELFRLEGGIGKFVTLGTFSVVAAYALFHLAEHPTQRIGKYVAERLVAVTREERSTAAV